jgi:hypothetical protein
VCQTLNFQSRDPTSVMTIFVCPGVGVQWYLVVEPQCFSFGRVFGGC